MANGDKICETCRYYELKPPLQGSGNGICHGTPPNYNPCKYQDKWVHARVFKGDIGCDHYKAIEEV